MIKSTKNVVLSQNQNAIAIRAGRVATATKEFKLIVVGHVGRRMNWSAIGNQCQSHFDVCGLHSVVKELWSEPLCWPIAMHACSVSRSLPLSLSQSLVSCIVERVLKEVIPSEQCLQTKAAYIDFFIHRCGCSYYFNNSTFMLLCAHTNTLSLTLTRARCLVVNLNSRTFLSLSLSSRFNSFDSQNDSAVQIQL